MSAPMSSESVTFLLGPEGYKLLQDRAVARGVSVAEYCRFAVQSLIRMDQGPDSPMHIESPDA